MNTTLFYWHYLNIQLGKCLYPELIHAPDFSWVLVPRFPLTERWNMESTPLLIIQAGLDGDIFHCCPNHFYCHKDLKLARGSSHSHIFYDNGWNDLSLKGYARVSWHINNWSPAPDMSYGHNLVSIFEGLDEFFRKG